MLHPSTFSYLKPTDQQMNEMDIMRTAAREYAAAVERHVPEGPDKTYLLRSFRTVAMWVNIAICRQPDGTPREE